MIIVGTKKWDKIRDQIWKKMLKQGLNQIGDQVWLEVNHQLWNQIDSQIKIQIRNRLYQFESQNNEAT